MVTKSLASRVNREQQSKNEQMLRMLERKGTIRARSNSFDVNQSRSGRLGRRTPLTTLAEWAAGSRSRRILDGNRASEAKRAERTEGGKGVPASELVGVVRQGRSPSA